MERSRSYAGLWLTAVGALIGGVLSTWLAPKMIAWYFTPPAQMGFNCVDPINWALHKMLVAQLSGIGVGAICGVAFYFTVFKGRGGRGRDEPSMAG